MSKILIRCFGQRTKNRLYKATKNPIAVLCFSSNPLRDSPYHLFILEIFSENTRERFKMLKSAVPEIKMPEVPINIAKST